VSGASRRCARVAEWRESVVDRPRGWRDRCWAGVWHGRGSGARVGSAHFDPLDEVGDDGRWQRGFGGHFQAVVAQRLNEQAGVGVAGYEGGAGLAAGEHLGGAIEQEVATDFGRVGGVALVAMFDKDGADLVSKNVRWGSLISMASSGAQARPQMMAETESRRRRWEAGTRSGMVDAEGYAARCERFARAQDSVARGRKRTLNYRVFPLAQVGILGNLHVLSVCGCSSVVEHFLAKEDVARSNRVTRSSSFL
jgi:hypothetical protein